jgi:hypothetical protein
MGYLWTGSRKQFPDYFCGKCYNEHIKDPETGIPLRVADYPDWIKTLYDEEHTRRERKRYWEKRGFQFEAIPISELQAKIVKFDEDLTDEEWLETLGELVT